MGAAVTLADRVSCTLAPTQSTNHAPSLALLEALRINQWTIVGVLAGTSILTHPTRGSIELRLDGDQAVPFIDGRQVSYRMATDLANGATRG